MAQTKAIIQALKRSLKAHGKTYSDVAVALDLTEASVKRLFAEQSFSLSRLDQVCQMLGIEISDLIKTIDEPSGQIQQLTKQQEKEISQDLILLLVTVCVLNRWTMDQILNFYKIEETECIRKLAFLDRLKIIELLPKNKIKLLVAPNFSWIENGPIQEFFQTKVAQEYFNVRFKKEDEKLIVLNGMLSAKSNAAFQRKMQRLAKEFDELNLEDSNLPFDERQGVTAIIAVRGWKYGLYSHLVREN